jgi:hypothetical protein
MGDKGRKVELLVTPGSPFPVSPRLVDVAVKRHQLPDVIQKASDTGIANL